MPAMAWTIHLWVACIAAAVISDHGASRRLRHLAVVWLRIAGAPGRVAARRGARARRSGAGDRRSRTWSGPRSGCSGRSERGAAPPFDRHRAAVGLSPRQRGTARPGVRADSGRLAIRGRRFSAAQLVVLDVVAGDSFFFPFGIIVLFVLGVIHGVRRWFAFFLLPISLLDPPEGLRQRLARRVPRQVPVLGVRHTRRAVSGALRVSRAVRLGGPTLLAGVVEACRRAAARRDRPRMESLAPGNSSAAGSSCRVCRPGRRSWHATSRPRFDTCWISSAVSALRLHRQDAAGVSARPTPGPATAGRRSEGPSAA